MPSILIAETDKNRQNAIKKRFENLGNEVNIVPSINDTALSFEKYIPDLVVLDYSHDIDTAHLEATKIMEFDHTACIFAITNCTEELTKKKIYASGARAVIQRPEKISTDEEIQLFFEKIINACNELKLNECIKCWESDVFTDTTKN